MLNKDLAKSLCYSLQPLGPITVKFMFGGAGLFYEGKMFGMVSSDNRVWLKVGDSNRAKYEELGMQQFNKTAKNKGMPYFQVPDNILNNNSDLLDWAEESIAIIKK